MVTKWLLLLLIAGKFVFLVCADDFVALRKGRLLQQGDEGPVRVVPDDWGIFRILDFFGVAVKIQGDTLVVGAQNNMIYTGKFGGIAYVFSRDDTGNWVQEDVLTPDDVGNHRSYLYAWNVDISGDTIIVGAMTNSETALFAGAAYVFVRNSQDGTWTQQQKLMAPDGERHDYFGIKVAIDGDTALVCAQYDTINGVYGAGSVYVFVRNDGVWTFQANLVPADHKSTIRFGSSLVIEGDIAAIGAPAVESYIPGAVYIFIRSGATWIEHQMLQPPETRPVGSFGDDISMSGGTLIASNYGDASFRGAVYVFTRNGSFWYQAQKLSSPIGWPLNFFSFRTAIDRDTLVVGAMFANSGFGEVYIYKRSNGEFLEDNKLLGRTFLSVFGGAVDISDGNIAVGAQLEGAVYVWSTGPTRVDLSRLQDDSS